MSNREMAISIINGFTEEQLIEFMEWHDQIIARERAAEQAKAAKEKELEERRRIFRRLTESIEKYAPLYGDNSDNDKEVLLEYRMRKYGEGL